MKRIHFLGALLAIAILVAISDRHAISQELLSGGGAIGNLWGTLGHLVIATSDTSSAVDYVQVTNSATGSPATVTVTATGSDSNINLNLVSKGTGTIECNGGSCGGGGGSGTVNSGTQYDLAIYAATGTAVSADSLLTDNGTTLAYTGTGGGSFAQVATTGSGPWTVASTPGTCGTSASSTGQLCFSSTGNRLVYGYNAGTNYNLILSSDDPALYNAAQTWTALQQFTNGDLAMLGSSTGYDLLETANAGSSNYTHTFPAATDTMADLTSAQSFITGIKQFASSILGITGSSTGYTLIASANSGSSNYTATLPAATNYVLEGDVSSSGGTPRLQEQANSTGSTSPAESTSSLLGILYVTKAITVRAAWIMVEVVASSCSTEPVYALYYNTSVSKTSATEISSSNCTDTATTLGAVSCAVSVTNVAAGDYVFWEVATAPSSCAVKQRLVYEYTMQ